MIVKLLVPLLQSVYGETISWPIVSSLIGSNFKEKLLVLLNLQYNPRNSFALKD